MSEVNLGLDRSGNNNHFAVVNMTLAVDQVLDSPTNNFATFNPIQKVTTTAYSEGNLKVVGPASQPGDVSTIVMSTGKWYCEIINTAGNGQVGIVHSDSIIGNDAHSVGTGLTGGYGYTYNATNRYTTDGASNTSDSYGGAFDNDDIIGIALDLDNNQITYYKNNASQGVANTGLTAVGYFFFVQTNNKTYIANFGQDSSFAGTQTAQGNQDINGIGDFYYAPPSGFLALCTKNLPEPTTDPKNHFNTITYAGNAANRTLTGVGFQPDFTWIKSRGNETNGSDHFLFDVVRGVNAFKGLFSNGPSIEGETEAGSAQENFGDISAFTSDGYSVVRSTADSSHQYEGVNNNSETYVAWNWKAGNANTAFSESGNNPAGTHRANVAAGFSIVSYVGTGAAGTVAHGLGVAPEWIIIKNRDVNDPWAVYYGDNTDYLVLNTNAATADAATYFNDTAPSATVFTVNSAHNVNADGENYIAYCFRSIDGYSKLGSYTGNGNANGPFVYLGFAPAFLMVKSISLGQAWTMVDNVREPVNPRGELCLFADELTEEFDPANINFDFTSTGFKVRNTDNKINNNGATYTYMAFAETPFKHASAK